ncbi:MAG TPA: hypothetical protein PKD66_11545, partial [Azonexus sp.]|nr:hypothetical protein [Azonexus sp.]
MAELISVRSRRAEIWTTWLISSSIEGATCDGVKPSDYSNMAMLNFALCAAVRAGMPIFTYPLRALGRYNST